MRLAPVALAIAAVAFGGARLARHAAASARLDDATARPYAPSPDSAPILALGYRELAADLLYVRMVGYFAAYDSVPEDSAALSEAIVALDPKFRRVYELGAVAMSDARRKPDTKLQLRAIEMLERGMREFPQSWKFPMLAGQILLSDMVTDDPAQRRRWDERGARLLELASRKPGAPADIAVHAAVYQTRLGQRERAIGSLRELLLLTNDARARQSILKQLAELEADSSDELAAELFTAKQTFERAWKRERPAVNASTYILIGPRIQPGFDLGDLAVGGRDLIGSVGFERLEPLTDP